mmetsp:Transcript_140727/g.366409  ORF Transcript_140727/g.366409 Transcript_140727/m.366409 type:complete len:115 (-) Transcript_140727:138-482(-)
MPTIDEQAKVEFHTIAREWRCKWAADAGKIALTKAQEVLDKHLDQLKAIHGCSGVQRIVCGGCLDFKVIVSINASVFPEWEGKQFEPEAAFLEELGTIDGITAIETQTYTIKTM